MKTGQVRVVLVKRQDVDDASALTGLLGPIPVDEPIDKIGGDRAHNTRHCHTAIAVRGATPSIPLTKGQGKALA